MFQLSRLKGVGVKAITKAQRGDRNHVRVKVKAKAQKKKAHTSDFLNRRKERGRKAKEAKRMLFGSSVFILKSRRLRYEGYVVQCYYGTWSEMKEKKGASRILSTTD